METANINVTRKENATDYSSYSEAKRSKIKSLPITKTEEFNFNNSYDMRVQDEFLESVCREQTNVSIYLVSGIRLKGTISSFDTFTLNLDGETKQLVYKHSVSTIMLNR